MTRRGSRFGGGQFLSILNQENPMLGAIFQRVIDGINHVASSAAVSANGQLAAPPAPDSVSVKAAGEMVHVAITHNAPVVRGVRYFTEAATSPSFSQPIVIDHGASRTSHPFPLPSKNDSGHVQTWYFRSYAQYPGSPPSGKTVYGGASSPVGIQLGGYTSMTTLPSRGSGTASPSGEQGGQGMGTVPKRPLLAQRGLAANAQSYAGNTPGGGTSGSAPGQISGAAGLVLATPTSGTGAAVLRALTASDLPASANAVAYRWSNIMAGG